MYELTSQDLERFFSKVNKTESCWLWTAAHNGLGYGRIRIGGRKGRLVYAHRLSYEIVNGPIPEGLVIDHLCRTPSCVNPSHLEAVSQKTNSQRGEAGEHMKIYNGSKTHCPSGHPYDVVNTHHHGGRRHCRSCSRLRMAEKRASVRQTEREAEQSCPAE